MGYNRKSIWSLLRITLMVNFNFPQWTCTNPGSLFSVEEITSLLIKNYGKEETRINRAAWKHHIE